MQHKAVFPDTNAKQSVNRDAYITITGKQLIITQALSKGSTSDPKIEPNESSYISETAIIPIVAHDYTADTHAEGNHSMT